MKTTFGNHFRIAILLLLPGAGLALLGYGVAGWVGFGLCSVLYSLGAIATIISAESTVLRRHGAAYIAKHQAPGLYGLAGELARRAGVPTPALRLMPESAAQLLVTAGIAGRTTVVLSRGLLQVLSREELAAVMAHAISRIGCDGVLAMTIAARWAEALISFSNFFRYSHLLPSKLTTFDKRDGIPSDAFLWVLIAPLAAALIRVATCPSRQFLSDESSVHLIGDDQPLGDGLRNLEAYGRVAPLESVSPATAHLFISNPLSTNGWARLFQAHPPVTERLERLEALGRRAVNSSAWPGVRHASQ
jgi:heat shock protein HtpX